LNGYKLAQLAIPLLADYPGNPEAAVYEALERLIYFIDVADRLEGFTAETWQRDRLYGSTFPPKEPQADERLTGAEVVGAYEGITVRHRLSGYRLAELATPFLATHAGGREAATWEALELLAYSFDCCDRLNGLELQRWQWDRDYRRGFNSLGMAEPRKYPAYSYPEFLAWLIPDADSEKKREARYEQYKRFELNSHTDVDGTLAEPEEGEMPSSVRVRVEAAMKNANSKHYYAKECKIIAVRFSAWWLLHLRRVRRVAATHQTKAGSAPEILSGGAISRRSPKSLRHPLPLPRKEGSAFFWEYLRGRK